MSQTVTIRPNSTVHLDDTWSLTGGASIQAVTSDNSDATYTHNTTFAGSFASFRLGFPADTAPAGHQVHRVRGRWRCATTSGAVTTQARLRRADDTVIGPYTSFVKGTGISTLVGSWLTDPAIASQVPLGRVEWGINRNTEGVTFRVHETYVDIDYREAPQFTPDVLDAAGVSQDGGTVTDTRQPTIVFGSVDYDGLPSLSWTVTVGTFTQSGSGQPPSELQTSPLIDGSYTAVFTVRSTIQGSLTYENTETVDFDLDAQPPPPPPALTATPTTDGVLLEWTGEVGIFDDDRAVIEIYRDDCFNTDVRILVQDDALNGSYLDRTIPFPDQRPVNIITPGGVTCASMDCEVTYRARYWGTQSVTVEEPAEVPAELILGWPSTVGTIPSGWTRVTDLDGLFPRGAAGDVSGTTGGAATHSHTSPSHQHQMINHIHSLGGSTGAASGTASRRAATSSETRNTANHTHTRPANTLGVTTVPFTGLTAPGTGSHSNDPTRLDVIWIESDGMTSEFPLNIVGFALQAIATWGDLAAAVNAFLRGATTGANGGGTGGGSHNHTVSSHTHTGVTHDHHNTVTTGNGTQATRDRHVAGNDVYGGFQSHSHTLTHGSASTGVSSASGGTTGSTSQEPLFRRLRVIQKTTSGGVQLGIIGLWLGDIASLPSGLTRCDGTNGTPDMRDWFAREFTGGSVNSTGGTTTHTHTTVSHTHSTPGHTHSVGVSSFSQTLNADATGITEHRRSHTHTGGGNTGSTAATLTSSGSGVSGSSSHTPPYREVHFVRVDFVGTSPVDIPVVATSEFASTTLDAPEGTVGMDRIVSGETTLEVCPDRSHALPRGVVDTTPIEGGLPTVATTIEGEDIQLTIARVGRTTLTALETALRTSLIWYQPYGGQPGWFAPGGWQVSPVVPGVKIVQVTLVRQPTPATEDPEDVLLGG